MGAGGGEEGVEEGGRGRYQTITTIKLKLNLHY